MRPTPVRSGKCWKRGWRNFEGVTIRAVHYSLPEPSYRADYVNWRSNAMAWSQPIIVEICVGMEITSYESAEI
ncbi:pyrroloquinoline quinone precursor peptide PqqA [Methylocystis sp.]